MFNYRKIRFVSLAGLIFCLWLMGCSGRNDKNNSLSLLWENNKAIAIVIPSQLIKDISKDSVQQAVLVHLANQTSILGEYSYTDSGVIFRPLIPFTPGLTYVVTVNNKEAEKIQVPAIDPKEAPAVLAVYPALDMLPENALKIHIQFSKPMQEGQSLQHISLIRNNRDTVTSVFLELQQELWNSDRTVLTLWFDPGRIKRDLQPNKTMGQPLHEGEHYQMIIQKDWRGASGMALEKSFIKEYVVGRRDDLSPDPAAWKIDAPAAKTTTSMVIDLREPLDYILLPLTIRVVDSINNTLPGKLLISKGETQVIFNPDAAWRPGRYKIQIESRLEDLAGNNMERLFDNDLSQQPTRKQPAVFERPFIIQ